MEEKDKFKKDSLRHLQACDQAGALMSHIAIVISLYFKALLENGLSREEALFLTNSYQNILIGNSLNGIKQPPSNPSDENGFEDPKNEDY